MAISARARDDIGRVIVVMEHQGASDLRCSDQDVLVTDGIEAEIGRAWEVLGSNTSAVKHGFCCVADSGIGQAAHLSLHEPDAVLVLEQINKEQHVLLRVYSERDVADGIRNAVGEVAGSLDVKLRIWSVTAVQNHKQPIFWAICYLTKVSCLINNTTWDRHMTPKLKRNGTVHATVGVLGSQFCEMAVAHTVPSHDIGTVGSIRGKGTRGT